MIGDDISKSSSQCARMRSRSWEFHAATHSLAKRSAKPFSIRPSFASDLPASRLLRARREGPRGRTAEQRDEVAPFQCPMPPVLLTERIAHLGTADCCIHPPGRNEMIAITPPILSSKEVAQKQATPFPRQDLLTARNRF